MAHAYYRTKTMQERLKISPNKHTSSMIFATAMGHVFFVDNNRELIVFRLEQRVIAHIVINSPNEKTFYAESEVEFTNMSDLIKYYHDHPVPNCTSNPVSITLK